MPRRQCTLPRQQSRKRWLLAAVLCCLCTLCWSGLKWARRGRWRLVVDLGAGCGSGVATFIQMHYSAIPQPRLTAKGSEGHHTIVQSWLVWVLPANSKDLVSNHLPPASHLRSVPTTPTKCVSTVQAKSTMTPISAPQPGQRNPKRGHERTVVVDGRQQSSQKTRASFGQVGGQSSRYPHI